MDLDEPTLEGLVRVLADRGRRSPQAWTDGAQPNRCPFVEKGSVSVRWDGAISPCLPLLHTARSYLDFRPRTSHAFSVGNVNEQGLADAWTDPAYVALRERLLAFDFAPCTVCNSCEMADENLEDCFGSPAPACGGCLWAQGLLTDPSRSRARRELRRRWPHARASPTRIGRPSRLPGSSQGPRTLLTNGPGTSCPTPPDDTSASTPLATGDSKWRAGQPGSM